jgi:transposase
MIKISLTEKAVAELNAAKSDSNIPEKRIIAVLLSNTGMLAKDIGPIVGYNGATTRKHLRAYLRSGLQGLIMKKSPGRLSKINKYLIPFLEECLVKSPTEYGWDKSTWDSTIIIKSFEKEHDESISHDSVSRAMKKMNYSYRRPQKSPSVNAPSKEEKVLRVKAIIEEITAAIGEDDCEIFCCDESHFTNEPYLTRGYFKKGGESINPNTRETRNPKSFWVTEYGQRRFLLEEY